MGYFLDDAITKELVPIVRDIQVTRFSEIASSTIIVYDHLVTLDQEVTYIWKAPWTMGKFLFILNRYYPLCSVIFNNYTLFVSDMTNEMYFNSCLSWFQWQGWTGLIACMIAEIILQVRLYALYFLDKKILAFMIVSFIATSACSAAIMGTVLSNFSAHSHLIPGLPFCIPMATPDYMYAFWVPILAFESLLCGMALFRGFQAFRYRHSVFESGRHLVTILLRDSIIYYLIVFVAYLINLLFWSNGRAGLVEVPVGFTVAMSCVMGNRLILNVRHMKRNMEESIYDREKSILHLPYTTNDANGDKSPSMIIFAQSRSMIVTPDSESEFIELKDMRRESIPQGHFVAL